MKKLLIVFALLKYICANPQSYDYSKITGNTGPDGGMIKTSLSGDIYEAGSFSGSIQINNNITLISPTIQSYLIKYDPCGNYISHLQNFSFPALPGYSRSMRDYWCVDNSGAVYTILCDYNGGPSPCDLVISKYNSALSLVWQKHIPNLYSLYGLKVFNSHDMTAGIIITGSLQGAGNILPVAMSQTAPSNNMATDFNTTHWGGVGSGFILKLDPNGNYLTHHFLGNNPQSTNTDEWSSTSSLQSFTQSSSSHIYQAGWFVGSLNFFFPPLHSCSPLGVNCQRQGWFFSKYTNQGAFMGSTAWSYVIRIPGINAYPAVGEGPLVASSNGNMIYAAGFTGNYWPYDITGTMSTSLLTAQVKDIVISGISSTGSFLWTKHIGGTGTDEVIDLKTDWMGSIYILGSFENTVNFAPGISLTASATSKYFLLKLDAAGNVSWVKQLNIDGEYYGCYPDATGSTVFLDGKFQNTVDFDPDPVNIDSKTSTGNYDHAFVKLSASKCPKQCTISLSGISGNETCTDHNGTITATVSGGVLPYQYSLDNINFQGSALFTGLLSGMYTLTVKDANGCAEKICIAVGNTPCPDCCLGGQWTSKSFTPVITLNNNPAGLNTVSSGTKQTPVQGKIPPGGSSDLTPYPRASFFTKCDTTIKVLQNSSWYFNGAYSCNTGLTGCGSQIKIKAEGPVNTGLQASSVPITFNIPGSYQVTYYALCGNKVCDSCKINVVVEVDCCRGSRWSSISPYTYAVVNNNGSTGAPQPLYNILDDPPGPVGLGIKTVFAQNKILVNMNYACAPGCGSPVYELIQKNAANSQVLVSSVFSGTTFISVYPFKTHVTIRPLCGGRNCGGNLVFYLQCNAGAICGSK